PPVRLCHKELLPTPEGRSWWASADSVEPTSNELSKLLIFPDEPKNLVELVDRRLVGRRAKVIVAIRIVIPKHNPKAANQGHLAIRAVGTLHRFVYNLELLSRMM